MAEWLTLKKRLITTWEEHFATLNQVRLLLEQYEKLSTTEQPAEGLGLVQDLGRISSNPTPGQMEGIKSQLQNAALQLQNQGIAIENYSNKLRADAAYSLDMARLREMYLKMGNLGPEHYISNQKGLLQNERIAVDNDGARVEVFGKVLENYSKHLENRLKEIEVVLKGFYAVGYRSYARSYLEYSEQIEKVWRTIGRVNSEANASINQLREYRRQAATCESRRKRLLRHQYRESNSELPNKNVSLSSVPRILNRFAATVEGESCLHKSLLSAQFQDVTELFKVSYQVSIEGKSTEVFCPAAVDLEVEGLDVMDYPQPVIDPTTFTVTGVYQPLTYYQVYRLFVDHGGDVQIVRPTATLESSVGCNPRVPGTRKYMRDSFAVEQAFAESYDVIVDPLPTESRGFAVDYMGIPPQNLHYRKFLDRMATIMRKTEQCIEDLSAKKSALPVAPAAAGETPAAAPAAAAPVPLQTGKSASDYFSYFNGDFPLLSESIRECMRAAEHHRYRAFAQLETVDALMEVMNKATRLTPPRSPHPVQFQPVNGPNTRPGNDVFP
jgi:hypothetical protein